MARVHSSMELTRLLHPSRMSTIDDIALVLEEFNAHLHPKNFLSVFEALVKEKIGLMPALIVSTLGEKPPLIYWFLERISDSNVHAICSLLSKILMELSKFFLEHQPASFITQQTIAKLRESHHILTYAPHILQGLLPLTTEAADRNTAPASASTTVRAEVPGRMESAFKTALRNIDDEAFRMLDISVPTGANQVDATIRELHLRLCEILEFYATILRNPEFEHALKSRIVVEASEAPVTTNPRSTDLTSSEYTFEPVSAFPGVRPVSYFENVEGFGDWRLRLTSRAENDMRRCSRKDRASLKIIVKKLRALSNGHFSADNQKILAHSQNGVPIYEAKMDSDKRIVYHVDLLQEDDQILVQCLNVLGVQYTHAYINNTNWEALSRQLGKRGKAYRKNCSIRRDPVRHGNDVCRPAFISGAQNENENESTQDEALSLPPDDVEQLHLLIGQEKYVEFSKPLLFNMLAGLDDHFPFDLSYEEREVVDHPGSCYVLGRSGTGKTITILRKMLEVERSNELCAADAFKQRQIFVTRSRILVKKVEKQFNEEMEALRTAALSPEELKQLAISRNALPTDLQLVDEDDRAEWQAGLPKRFSELEDKHYPLFISFDDMCTMLEADLFPSSRHQEMLDYNKFCREYWGHLPVYLTKRLDPSLVYNEIIGVICGSEATLLTPQGYLDQSTYENMSKGNPVFAECRQVVYTLFRAVLKKKILLGDLDAAQRTHRILRNLREHDISSWKVYQIYVDEVQDHLLVDTLLLRSICNNPNGLHWAGDTAQTISRGSSFSFNELKSFLYRIETRRKKDSFDTSYQAVNPPRIFQLTTNYRSHSGIVNVASSIVELITRYWSDSIDKLEPERGVGPGVKPAFFEGSILDHKDALFPKSQNKIPLGAEQCILVRHEEAKRKLEKEMGKLGLIFTIHESKGLEFNDVLIYDFFKDSEFDIGCWKLVLNAVEDALPGLHIPSFHQVRHGGLCLELKTLYVGVTRARNRLWIADGSDKAQPMRVFWNSRQQIEIWSPANYPVITQESTPAQWLAKGHELFLKKHYLHAKQCYENAQAPHAIAVSDAYVLRESALQTSTLASNHRISFKIAAEAFLHCSEDPMNNVNKVDYLREAGKCFERSSYNVAALDAYERAEAYNELAQLALKIGKYDYALQIIQEHQTKMRKDVHRMVQAGLRLHYFVAKKFDILDSLFDRNVEAQIKHFSKADRTLRLEHLLHHRRFDCAAGLELDAGHSTGAIEFYLCGWHYRLAKDVMLRELWQGTAFKTRFTANVTQFYNQAKKVQADHGCFDQAEADELDLFSALLSSLDAKQKRIKLFDLAQNFKRAHRSAAYVLSLDQYFVMTPPVFQSNYDIFQTLDSLEKFAAYAEALRNLTLGSLGKSGLAQLFGLRQVGTDMREGRIFVPPSSILHQRVQASSASASSHSSLIAISPQQLVTIALNFFAKLLLERVQTMHKFLHGVAEIEGQRSSSSQTSITWHNTWFSCLMTQIAIVSHVEELEAPTPRAMNQLLWIRSMFHAFHAMGLPSAMIIVPAMIVKSTVWFAEGVKAAVRWISDTDVQTGFYGYVPPNQGVTFALSALGFLARFDYPGFSYLPAKFFERLERLVTSTSMNMKGSNAEKARLGKEFQNLVAIYDPQEVFKVGDGVDFLRTILRLGCVIDVEIFFTVLENLCSMYTVSQYYETKETHSGLVLPRSWLFAASSHQNCETHPSDISGLLLLFEDLLKCLCLDQGSDQFIFGIGGRSIRSVRDTICEKYICRMLLSMGLVGLNLQDTAFRGKVLKLIQDVSSSNQLSRYSQPAKSFLQVTVWSEMGPLIRQSLRDSPVDGLIQIYEKGRQDQPLPSIPIILYQNFFHDLPPFLCRWAETSKMPTPHPNQEIHVHGNESSTQVPSQKGKAASLCSDELQSIWHRQASFTVGKYRRYVLLRRNARAIALRSRDTYEYQLLRCLRLVEEAKWPHSTYRILFLAVIPHTLFSLGAAKHALNDRKVEIRTIRQSLKEKGDEPSDLLDSQESAIDVLSVSILDLTSALELTSDVHSRHDTAALKAIMQQVMLVLGQVAEIKLDTKFRDSFRILSRVRQ
ncbi:unnamed protein product [Cyclocybe aegerita]|uniref:UvrD-like helicase ATP-binding domain-containing protein n=1 Tax=Cyclocybe aegerita TaxID=1973307 RepID=A0A8S0WWS7_CYCAE|nr:unnamed protein product [Cyclocybe aegerita]